MKRRFEKNARLVIIQMGGNFGRNYLITINFKFFSADNDNVTAGKMLKELQRSIETGRVSFPTNNKNKGFSLHSLSPDTIRKQNIQN
jgi:hypothetical protein